ncbi:MAG: ACT domain-containing protein [Elusimicrobiaceae bacterium]|nr:ACT domain-containing protein [Elusimicrobiaceae bacterium]
MNIEILRQYSVFLPNKPGVLSKFLLLFKENNINIAGISSEISDDSSVVRIVLEGGDKLSGVLAAAGHTTIETQILSIEMPDKPGQLQLISELLGEAGVNLSTVYGTSTRGGKTRLLLTTNDTLKAKKVLDATPF